MLPVLGVIKPLTSLARLRVEQAYWRSPALAWRRRWRRYGLGGPILAVLPAVTAWKPLYDVCP